MAAESLSAYTSAEPSPHKRLTRWLIRQMDAGVSRDLGLFGVLSRACGHGSLMHGVDRSLYRAAADRAGGICRSETARPYAIG